MMVNEAATISCYWKVSSKTNYDFLGFYVDGWDWVNVWIEIQ